MTLPDFLKEPVWMLGKGLRQWVLLVAVWIPVHAGLADSPSTDGTSTGDLDREVRSALAGTVGFFKKRAAEDPEGWVVPPTRTRKVVNHEVVILRYREVTREVPVYKYEYEEYEVVQKVRVGDSSAAVETYRKVKMRRVVSRKQTGTTTVKRLVRDPDGSIEKEHHIPQYGPGGPDVWPRYAIGDNALALYALRRSGVSVTDSMVAQLAVNLNSFINNYGYPDETWDLAWLTAAFSNLPTEYYQETARELAAKLLDGQIRDGDAAGLWGPVSIHTALLAEQMMELEKRSKKFAETKKLAGKGNAEERAAQRAEQAYQETLSDLLRVATFGMAGHLIESAVAISPGGLNSIRMAGLNDYIYNQRTADLGTTALALYALRQASENEVFPNELWRPESTKLRSESPLALVTTSMHLLAKELVEKRGWDEMNRYQAVNDLDKVGTFPGLPGADVEFPKPASRTSKLTVMQGFSAMSDAARIVDSDSLDAKYRRHLEKGAEFYRASAEDLIGNWPSENPKAEGMAPYDHCLFLSKITRESGSSREDRRDLWEPLARGLLAMQSTDGSCRQLGPGRVYQLPTSLLARIAVMEEPEKGALVEYGKPHVERRYRALAAALKGDKKVRVTAEDVVPTALTMVFLAENVRPPVIGECLWTEEAGSSGLIPPVISVMRQQQGMAFRYSAVERPLSIGQLVELPVVLIRGAGAFDPDDEELKALGDYLDQGGLVLIETAADPEGAKFLSKAEIALKSVLPESSTLEDIGSDEDLMGAAVGKASVRAIRQPNGSLSVVFLPLSVEEGKDGLSRSTAARAMYNLLFQKIDPDLLEEDYPVSVIAEGSSVETEK
jgi:hypothetical protein